MADPNGPPFGSCEPGCEEHYGCRLRNKGLQVSPKVTSTATQNWRPTPSAPPTRNRQIMYEDRGGGMKMPIVREDGRPVRQKYYDEHKKQITSTLTRIRGGATQPGG